MKNINKKALIIIQILILFFVNIIWVSAVTITVNSDIADEINFEDTFKFYSDIIDDNILDSYKYIKLNFKWVEKESELYKSLQKLVYFNLINNSETYIKKDKIISWYVFYTLLEKIFNLDVINLTNEKKLKNRKANKWDLILAEKIINNKSIELNNFVDKNKVIKNKKEIFSDVYSTILNSHYDKKNLSEEEVITSAIEWLAKWTDDKHTVYFPPTETKDFYESLNGEFEWIWSYVELEKPWVMKILSPIKNSPAEKAWLKWWDIVLKVDWREINEENSLREIVSWIKWPSWTNVTLTIKRNEKIFDVNITREKIIIKDVEFEKLNYNTFYIEIKNFWDHVSNNFKIALEELSKESKIKKIIIDLRSNWWGYLWEVSDMLSYFVEKWDNTAVVKYLNQEKSYKSKWYELIDFSKYKIVILQNSWTASASEIMIWTIKDYFPETIIIWEQSYWKWSVQTIKTYSDWSTFKYTVAKWFTWKTKTWIDGVWITPDIELEIDFEKYKKDGSDNQLEKAKQIR